MGVAKESLILYSLDLLLKNGTESKKYSRDQLAVSLDISEKTLDLYLSRLKKDGFIERIKKHHPTGLDQIVRITPEGKKELEKIKDEVGRELITPERHNSPTIVPVPTILERIRDPLERIFFLSLYTRSKSFDLPTYIETMKEVKSDYHTVRVLAEIDNRDQEEIPLIDTFFKTRYFNQLDRGKIEDGYFDRTDPNNLLMVAEASCKQGRFTDARTIYEYLLSDRIKLNQNQWFIAKTGLALLTSKEGDVDEAIFMLDDIIERTENKIYHSYAKQLKARIYSNVGEYERAMSLYNAAVNSFRTLGIPIMCAIVHNNRGVLHFRMGIYQKAEEDWVRAKKFASEAGCEHLKGPIYGNLGDLESMKGNMEKSEKYLKESMKIFNEIGDYEGRSYAEFNFSLYYLTKKDLKKALEYFKRSEEIAYPFPSPPERREKRKYFKERALEAGFEDPWIEELDDIDKSIGELTENYVING